MMLEFNNPIPDRSDQVKLHASGTFGIMKENND